MQRGMLRRLLSEACFPVERHFSRLHAGMLRGVLGGLSESASSLAQRHRARGKWNGPLNMLPLAR